MLAAALQLASDPDDAPSCDLMSDEERETIAELAGVREDGVLDAWVQCDSPSEDPSLTCFLTPDSWINEDDGNLKPGKYLCIDTPSPWTAPTIMKSDDSY